MAYVSLGALTGAIKASQTVVRSLAPVVAGAPTMASAQPERYGKQIWATWQATKGGPAGVALVQSVLAKINVYHGNITRVWDAPTKAAWSAFAKQAGVDGSKVTEAGTVALARALAKGHATGNVAYHRVVSPEKATLMKQLTANPVAVVTTGILAAKSTTQPTVAKTPLKGLGDAGGTVDVTATVQLIVGLKAKVDAGDQAAMGELSKQLTTLVTLAGQGVAGAAEVIKQVSGVIGGLVTASGAAVTDAQASLAKAVAAVQQVGALLAGDTAGAIASVQNFLADPKNVASALDTGKNIMDKLGLSSVGNYMPNGQSLTAIGDPLKNLLGGKDFSLDSVTKLLGDSSVTKMLGPGGAAGLAGYAGIVSEGIADVSDIVNGIGSGDVKQALTGGTKLAAGAVCGVMAGPQAAPLCSQVAGVLFDLQWKVGAAAVNGIKCLFDIGGAAEAQARMAAMQAAEAGMVKQKEELLKALASQEQAIWDSAKAQCAKALGYARNVIPREGTPEYQSMLREETNRYDTQTGGADVNDPSGRGRGAMIQARVDARLLKMVEAKIGPEWFVRGLLYLGPVGAETYRYTPGDPKYWWRNMPKDEWKGGGTRQFLKTSITDDGKPMLCRLPNFGDWHWGVHNNPRNPDADSKQYLYALGLKKHNEGEGFVVGTTKWSDVEYGMHVDANNLGPLFDDADAISTAIQDWNNSADGNKERWDPDGDILADDKIAARMKNQLEFRVKCQIRAHLQQYTRAVSTVVSRFLDGLAQDEAVRAVQMAHEMAKADLALAQQVQAEIEDAKKNSTVVVPKSDKELNALVSAGGSVVKDKDGIVTGVSFSKEGTDKGGGSRTLSTTMPDGPGGKSSLPMLLLGGVAVAGLALAMSRKKAASPA